MSGQHAIWAPSKADRWATCPGSVAMEEGHEDRPSEAADEGAAAHLVYNLCLRLNFDALDYLDQEVIIGTVPMPGGVREEVTIMAPIPDRLVKEFRERTRVVMTQERLEDLQLALDSTRSVLGQDDPVQEEHRAVFYEHAVPLLEVTGEDATGTADVIALLPTNNELQIHDLKFGRREVRPNCRQLKMYACAALDKFDQAYGPFNCITLVIHQPRIHGDKAQIECLTATELEAFRKEILEAAESSRGALDWKENWMGKDTSYLVPSEEACRYCRAAGECPAQDNYVAKAACPDMFEDLDAGESVSLVPAFQALASRDPRIMPVDSIPIELKLAAVEVVEAWCEAVKDAAYRLAMHGAKIPGYKLVMGRRGNRAWGDPAAAEETLKGMRLKQDEMYTYKVKSPTAIEKIYGPKGSAPSVRKWNKLQAMITQADGKPSLVPVADTRTEYVPVRLEFEDLGEEGEPFNPEDMA